MVGLVLWTAFLTVIHPPPSLQSSTVDSSTTPGSKPLFRIDEASGNPTAVSPEASWARVAGGATKRRPTAQPTVRVLMIPVLHLMLIDFLPALMKGPVGLIATLKQVVCESNTF
jgi:hypothetical protein